ncbi:MAG: DUF2804 domain-containing protein [Pseudomonas sp.]
MNSFTSASALAPASLQLLCDAQGRLDPGAIGWSTRPQVHCALPAHFGRRKRWNHWCITTPQWMLSLTVANLDYVGYGAAYFLDLETGRAATHTLLRPFGRGCELPDTPLESHEFCHPRLQIKVSEHPGRLRLTVAAANFGGQPLQVALDIQRPAHLDSVNLVVPFAGQGFHATSRQLGLPANGSVQLGQQHYSCVPGQSFAALDFGRGVWPFRSHWTRAAFAAPGGIAGNFGTGWTEHSGLSENALWFGGELLHLNCPVQIEQLPGNGQPHWRLSTADQRLALTFSPRQQHQARPRLGPLYAHTRQWFGHFDGVLRGPNGERVPVDGALGWLGETHARW